MARKVPFDQNIQMEYRALWQMQVRASWRMAIDRAARYAIKHKERYVKVSKRLGGNIPWEFIAALHWRESGGSFKRHLHNGDPLTARTRRIPRGRPPHGSPPFAWEESAIDALQMKGLHNIVNWTNERICYEAERYNGWGYRLYRGHPSPYLWSGTLAYTRGKYISDRVYSASAVDKQVGVIPLIKRIRELDTRRVVVETSRKLSLGRRIIQFIQGLFATIASLFTLDSLGVVREWVTLGDLIDPAVMVTLGLCALGVYVLVKTYENLTIQDHKEGRYTPSGYAVDDPDIDAVDEHFDGPADEGSAGSASEMAEWEDHAGGAGSPSEDRGSDLADDAERPTDRPLEG